MVEELYDRQVVNFTVHRHTRRTGSSEILMVTSGILIVGMLAGRYGLGDAISMACLVYTMGGLLLLTGILAFVKKDAARFAADL